MLTPQEFQKTINKLEAHLMSVQDAYKAMSCLEQLKDAEKTARLANLKQKSITDFLKVL